MADSAKRNAKVEITSSAAGMDRGINDARRKMRALEREQVSAAKKVKREEENAAKARSRTAMGVPGMALSAITAIAGIDLTGGLAAMGRDIFDFERKLTRFQIIAGMSADEVNKLRTEINGISRDTAMSREQVLAGAQTYVDLTGDVKNATLSMRAFARIAQASDSDIASVATSAAAMRDAMHIDPSQFETVFSGLISQGKLGAVNLKDFAGELSSILPRFAQFGVTGAEGVREMGAMFQVGRKGFGDASQTATGMVSLMGGLTLHADKFAKAGVKIFNVGKDGTKTFRPLSEIITDIGTSKLAKDPTLLVKAFGRKEGLQFYNMLVAHADELHDLEVAGENTTAVMDDLNTVLTSPAGKIDAAWNSIKVRIAEAVTPERIDAFSNALASAINNIERMVDKVEKLWSFAQKFDKYASYYDYTNPVGMTKKGIGAAYDYITADNRLDTADDALTSRLNARGAEIKRGNSDLGDDDIRRQIAQEVSTSLHFQSQGFGNELSMKELNALLGRARDPQNIAEIIAAIREGFKGATVSLDGSKVNKGAANSMHARQQSGQGG